MWTRRNIFFVACFILIHLLAVLRSEGPWHHDEHFQILEYGSYLAGFASEKVVAWEFHETMRPLIQPMVVAGFLKWFGPAHPFLVTFLLRLLSLMLSIGASWLVFRELLKANLGSSRVKDWLISIFVFLCYLPFLRARISAEAIGASVFLLFFWMVFMRRRYTWLAGLTMAIGFFVRFQMAFAYFGLFVWALFFERHQWRRYVTILVCFVVGCFLMVSLDSWGYGKWVFTPWHYFRLNILENKAAQWGLFPWWHYFRIAVSLIPPIGIAGLIFFFIWIYYRRKNPLSWAALFFLVGHMAVGHKENRFLFWLYLSMPLFVADLFLSVEWVKSFGGMLAHDRWRTILRRLGVFSLGMNAIYLTGFTLLPVRNEFAVYHELWRLSDRQAPMPLTMYSLQATAGGKGLFGMAGFRIEFYMPPKFQEIFVKDEDAFLELLPTQSASTTLELYLYKKSFAFSNPQLEARCRLLRSSVGPDWVLHVLPERIKTRIYTMNLYGCR